MIEAAEFILHLRIHPATGILAIVPHYAGQPGNGVDVVFDPASLDASVDQLAYGRRLRDMVFQPAIKQGFQRMMRETPPGAFLRVRIAINDDSPQLAAVPWELMLQPDMDSQPLSRNAKVLFSRYIASDSGGVCMRPPSKAPRVVFVVANPTNLREEGLDPIQEPDRYFGPSLQAGWEPVKIGGNSVASQTRIETELAQGCDLLCLVCHGEILNGKAVLFLEDDSPHSGRKASAVSAEAFADLLTTCTNPPRLVFLGSCYSSHDGKRIASGSLTNTIGLQLVQRGIQAVVGMQGRVEMDFLAMFAEEFFQQLSRVAAPDLAINAARRRVARSEDWWRPVLYMADPHLAWPAPVRVHGAADLTSVIESLDRGTCCPIIGPDVGADVLGSTVELAGALAEATGFPFEGTEAARDLAQVSRYVNVRGLRALHSELGRIVKERIRRSGEIPTVDLEPLTVEKAVRLLRQRRKARGVRDPFTVLASLSQVPVYLTTEPWGLLASALADVGRPPVVEICRWNETLARLPSFWDGESTYIPSPERPLVYELFGRWDDLDSLVLDDDAQLAYVANLASETAKVPTEVLAAISTMDHLYVGFHVESREFRLLRQAYSTLMRSAALTNRGHVVIQVSPVEWGASDEDAAKRYLQEYFAPRSSEIRWLTVRDFFDQLAVNSSAGPLQDDAK